MKCAFIGAALLAAVAALPTTASAQGRDLSITIGPGGVRVDSERDRRGPPRDWRPRCFDRRDVSHALERQGWRDLHDWDRRRDKFVLKARQWGGLFRLEVDECYGQLLEAKRVGWDRNRWGWDYDRDRRGPRR